MNVEHENVFGLRPQVLMVILGSLVLGGLFFAIGYIVIGLGRRNKKKDITQNSAKKDIPKSRVEENLATNELGPSTNNTMTNSKRARKKRREAQQEFNHSWMVGALKGHTAPVRDINFSSSGKYLASCAEDCRLAPEEKLDLVKSSKSKVSTSSSATKEREEKTPLSRRQRKNRTRAPREQRREHQERVKDHNESPNESSKMIYIRHAHDIPPITNPFYFRTVYDEGPPIFTNVPLHLHPLVNGPIRRPKKLLKITSPSAIRDEMKDLSNATIESMLEAYVLNEDQMLHGGFPVLHKDDPKSVIVCLFARHHNCTIFNHLNVNAREFVPKKSLNSWKADANAGEFVPSKDCSAWKVNENETDSGNGSGSSLENSDLEQESSSDSDKCSDISESSISSSDDKIQCILPGPVNLNESNTSQVHRRCVRCSSSFYVDPKTGEYLETEMCVYHWGKRRYGGWECCSYYGIQGCISAQSHVWSGVVPEATNGPLEGYVSTKPAGYVPKNGYGLYAIDCEMCFTKNGLELTKVSVVDADGSVRYDEYVKPEAEIIDYNTRFSGVTEQNLMGVTKTLKDVQNDLLKFIHAETILIGHGLENDLRALRIIHRKSVDTSFAYLNGSTPLYRKSLKVLAQVHLNKTIQTHNHDSIEDARTAMDLMLRKLQVDYMIN